MKFSDSAARFVATGGPVGSMPVAPGTFGTLLGLPICFGLSRIDLTHAVICCVFLIGVAVWSAHRAEKIIGARDPGGIVIDEIAGMAVTLVGLPFTVKSAVLGFMVFRLLDIVKPPPVGYLDRKLSGGIGIVTDDVAAGVIGNFLLRLVFSITGA